MICRYCQKECKNKNSFAQHERSCPNNLNRNYKNGMLGKKGSNQFLKAKRLGLPLPEVSILTKEKLSRAAKVSSKIYWANPENRQRQSEQAKKNGLGGVRQSKWIRYNGRTLGSSYELIVAKSLDENSIRWENRHKFSYIDPLGKKRTYTPDFYLIDYQIYLDPKNSFLINNVNPSLGFTDIKKIELVQKQNGIRIIILDKTELSWNIIEKKIYSL